SQTTPAALPFASPTPTPTPTLTTLTTLTLPPHAAQQPKCIAHRPQWWQIERLVQLPPLPGPDRRMTIFVICNLSPCSLWFNGAKLTILSSNDTTAAPTTRRRLQQTIVSMVVQLPSMPEGNYNLMVLGADNSMQWGQSLTYSTRLPAVVNTL
ncbi:hypothetical protein QJQ45_029322, partial [Haematococcus lacustris]